MPKHSVFTMKLESELRTDFMAEAEACDRPASQIVRELMREFVQQQRQTRDYQEFLRDKVATARKQISTGNHLGNEAVEARFAELRQQLSTKTVND